MVAVFFPFQITTCVISILDGMCHLSLVIRPLDSSWILSESWITLASAWVLVGMSVCISKTNEPSVNSMIELPTLTSLMCITYFAPTRSVFLLGTFYFTIAQDPWILNLFSALCVQHSAGHYLDSWGGEYKSSPCGWVLDVYFVQAWVNLSENSPMFTHFLPLLTELSRPPRGSDF